MKKEKVQNLLNNQLRKKYIRLLKSLYSWIIKNNYLLSLISDLIFIYFISLWRIEEEVYREASISNSRFR